MKRTCFRVKKIRDLKEDIFDNILVAANQTKISTACLSLITSPSHAIKKIEFYKGMKVRN